MMANKEMNKTPYIKNLIMFAVLLAGLVVSGCVSDTPAETTTQDIPVQQVSAADSALANEAVGLTDTEIMDIESDMAELKSLLSDMDMEENLSLEGI
ncbi:MAG TPA: hypothetical protein C5S50_11750 [Methanosarcinaceae archaeon]|nr:hypothetical protein [Methanosarcinaceae archaeon]